MFKNMQVRIRAYRVGLGDCFLLSFFQAAATKTPVSHVLIDCGVDISTPGGAEKIRKAAEDIAKETQANLDLLVATHEHWDHVSGFVQAESEFGQLNIENVWLAWTEDSNDEFARALKQEKELAIQGIAAAARQLVTSAALQAGERSALQEAGHATAGLLSLFGAAGLGAAKFSKNTDKAMDFVSAKKKDGDFCLPGGKARALPGLPGVRFYVLGPPKDETALRAMNPSGFEPETYEAAMRLDPGAAVLAAAAGSANQGAADGFQDYPFPSSEQIRKETAQGQDLFQKTYFSQYEDWRRIEFDWLSVSTELALQLDNAVNNTSLVLAIELVDSGHVLLFAGDAQVGNWLSWGKHTWTVTDQAGGAERQVTLDDLLARTVLYKVGHHGSHNGTLRERGLELISHPDLVAIIPVDEAYASDKKGWTMPHPPLYERLMEKCHGRVLRTDRAWPTTDDEKPDALSKKMWDKFLKATDVQPEYIDFTVS